MARRFVTAALVTFGMLLIAPVGAQARTACAAEESAPTAADSAQVSDAIFCMTNQIRASFGLTAFRRDARLDAAARLHSEDMAARGYFAHDTPEGRTPTDRAAAQGYTSGVGENIASGYATARAVMIGWMASAGHCQNILGVARDIGVGTAATPRPHYTQDFGDYDFGASDAATAACPLKLDLDALVIPDLPARPVVAGPATSTSLAGTSPSPAAIDPATGPALGKLGLSSARLRVGGRGVVVSYNLSALATVAFRIERQVGGHYTTMPGSFTAAGLRGDNTLTFRGRLRGRALAAGRYRLRAAATDGAGNASAVQRVRFRVVRPLARGQGAPVTGGRRASRSPSRPCPSWRARRCRSRVRS